MTSEKQDQQAHTGAKAAVAGTDATSTTTTTAVPAQEAVEGEGPFTADAEGHVTGAEEGEDDEDV